MLRQSRTELWSLFCDMDTDASGTLDKSELYCKMMQLRQAAVSEEFVNQMYVRQSCLDSNEPHWTDAVCVWCD